MNAGGCYYVSSNVHNCFFLYVTGKFERESVQKQRKAAALNVLRLLKVQCYCLYFAISSLSRSFDTPKYLRMFSSAYAGRSSMK